MRATKQRIFLSWARHWAVPTCLEPESFLPGFHNASSSFVVQHVRHKELCICFHSQRKITHWAGPPGACGGTSLFHLLGFIRAIFQFAQQTYVLIQRSFKSTERLLLTSIGFGSRCPGEQGTVGPKIGSHRWHSSHPQPHPHPPPAPPGHSFVATGRCLHHGPIDTGQSSRKPSKSWV